MNKLIAILAGSQSNFINIARISIFVVMAWIGGLKVYQYEADGIVPFVTNSPFMSFFYNNSGKVEIGRAQSELQSRPHLVCRLLLEKKKKITFPIRVSNI